MNCLEFPLTDAFDRKIRKLFDRDNLLLRGKGIGELRAAQLGTTPQFTLSPQAHFGNLYSVIVIYRKS